MNSHPGTIDKDLCSLWNNGRRDFLDLQEKQWWAKEDHGIITLNIVKKIQHNWVEPQTSWHTEILLTSKFSVPHSSKNSKIGYAAEPTVI